MSRRAAFWTFSAVPALLAAIYLVSYLAFAMPAVIACLLVTRIGLHDASPWYGAGGGVLAPAGLAGTILVGRTAGS